MLYICFAESLGEACSKELRQDGVKLGETQFSKPQNRITDCLLSKIDLKHPHTPYRKIYTFQKLFYSSTCVCDAIFSEKKNSLYVLAVRNSKFFSSSITARLFHGVYDKKKFFFWQTYIIPLTCSKSEDEISNTLFDLNEFNNMVLHEIQQTRLFVTAQRRSQKLL